MNLIFGGVPVVIWYMDDIAVFAVMEQELEDRLRKVLTWFQEQGLKLNRDKCVLAYRKWKSEIMCFLRKSEESEAMCNAETENWQRNRRAVYIWGRKIFKDTKKALTSELSLAYFQLHAPKVVSIDASPIELCHGAFKNILYLSGCKFVLQTDQKPLIQLLNQSATLLPPWIEQLSRRLQPYHHKTERIAEKANVEDSLCRLPLP